MVDAAEPRPLRPQPVAISERSNDDEWGMGRRVRRFGYDWRPAMPP